MNKRKRSNQDLSPNKFWHKLEPYDYQHDEVGGITALDYGTKNEEWGFVPSPSCLQRHPDICVTSGFKTANYAFNFAFRYMLYEHKWIEDDVVKET